MHTTTVPIAEAAERFLAQRRIAVTGVSRTPGQHGSNAVYQRLRKSGYEVFAVNPNATEVEGDPAYPNLAAIDGGVDAVVIATRPDYAVDTMREAADLGIKHVWMHRAFGEGSLSEVAGDIGRARGIEVIDGGCPLMFGGCSDGAHRMMRRILTWTGKVPKRV